MLPANDALDRVTALCGAAMRTTVAVVGGTAALVGIVPPVRAWPVVVAVAVSIGWSAVFAWIALDTGLRGWLMAVDLAVTSVFCLAQGRLVAEPILPGGVSWIAGLATMSIVIANFAWRPHVAVPAGLVIVIAHLVGARWGGAADGGLVPAGIQVVQVAATAALMTVLRRAARAADETLAAARAAQQAAEAERVRRADEREQNRRMHDTVLATLVTIGAGGVPAGSAMLRERAARELALLGQVGQAPRVDETVSLDAHLRAAGASTGLPINWRLAACPAPAPVAAAFTGATVEALANVARHARGGRVEVRLTAVDGRIRVEITDDGPGFDAGQVPGHRYGIREAIVGRMRSVDGDAEVSSDVGHKTTVLLRWPR
ncbi:Signal transduction histidine kinase [Micromonospora eburnea]|uniref:Signal transduction histidine kinase n=2 Tax=Micromonospora eburnea TaxID=227316 RepID=A0A1C6U9I6_9ACTN|nr:Signal transduction histidine kinase [Micromonospora eburnea]